MPEVEGVALRDRCRTVLLRFAPVVAILALQLVVFPVPAGVWVKGAIIGGLTALIALGMALTWRSNGIVSFAQGDLGLAPVVLVHLLIVSSGWSWWMAVPSGLVAAALLGAVVEMAVIRRFRKAPRLLLTVATIGLAQVLAGVAIVLPRLFDEVVLAPRITPPFTIDFSIGGVNFNAGEALAMAAVPGVVALLAVILRRSSIGLATRAAADSADRAGTFGIPVGRVQTAVWSFAAVLAFVAVLLRAGVLGLPLGPALSLGLLLRALTALLLGRLTDLPVVAATAVALGVLELSVAFNSSSAAALDPILAAVVALSLLLRGRTARLGARTADREAHSWRSADEVRPIPATLARLAPVRAVRIGGTALLIAIALALPYILPVDRSLKSSALLIYALLGLSIVVLTGWAGQLSLGQVALFAIGAAVGAKATTDWGLDLTVGLLLAALAGAGAAVVVGFPALRLHGLELAVVTLAAALATTSWLLNPREFSWVPGQSTRVERPPLLGQLDISSSTAIHHLSLVLLLVGLMALRGIRASRTGRALLALRDNERGAQAYGLSPLRLRLTAFALSGGLAGLAGGMFAHHQQAFGSQPFSPEQNFAIFTMVVLGGIGSPMGAVLGALYLQGTRWFLPAQWQLLASGGGVLLVLLLMPSGLGGLVVRIRDAWLARVADSRGLDVPGFTSSRSSSVTTGVSRAAVTVRAQADPQVPPAGRAAGTDDRQRGAAPLLAARGVEVGYDGVQVLFGIDLDVAEGEILALLGTNGAGKSTLLRAICGVTEADRGAIIFDGREITHAPPHEIAALGVRLMAGGAGIFASLSVQENLRAAAWLQRKDKQHLRSVVAAALAPFPALEDRRAEPAGNLSGGQQQQLALSMALLAHPRLLLVDELSLGLAPVIVSHLLPLLRRAREAGSTVVLVEQSADVALAIADRAMFLERGEVRFDGPAADLRGRTDLLRAVFLPSAPPSADNAATAKDGTVPHPPGQGAAGQIRLRAAGLMVSFGGNKAVDDVTLEVMAGEIVGVVGPNGAGKTTLFDLLSGYLPPDRGRIFLGERDVTDAGADARARAGLGRSFQDARLFPGLTVEEGIAVACERWVAVRDPLSAALRLPWSYDSERRITVRVAELVELVGLGPHRSKLIRELSTGTRRVVDLACLLAHRPSVILLDEPSSGIAQRESEALGPLLRRIRTETGASLVVVEHDIPLVRAVAERMIAMDRGAIIANGTPDEVLSHPDVVRAYLGVDAVAIDRTGHHE